MPRRRGERRGWRVDSPLSPARHTRLPRVAESGCCACACPTGRRGCEAVLINTGRRHGRRRPLRVSMSRSAAGARAVVTTQAAEKIYRSQRSRADIACGSMRRRGRRSFGCRRRRSCSTGAPGARRRGRHCATDATLCVLSRAVVFGRAAMGETHERRRLFRDRWRVRRGGRLVFAEARAARRRRSPTLLDASDRGGRRARLATLLHVAPDAEARLDAAARGDCRERARLRRQRLERPAGRALLSPDRRTALRRDVVARSRRARQRRCRALWLRHERRPMNLTPREKDKLLIAMAAMVARRRLERGVKLNHPGSGGAHHRFRRRGRARRPHRRRADGATAPCRHARDR